MNRSRPSIKPYQRTYGPQAVPFKKRDRFLYADDTTSQEIISPSDDRRVCSRSDVANTGDSNKTKKSSNTAYNEVAYSASMSPLAMSEDDPVKKKDGAKKPEINAPSEPQGAFVVDGGIKQVYTLKEVTEHEGDGGNNDGVVIDKKIIKQEEGGADRSTRSIEYIVISSSDSEHELDDTYLPIVGQVALLKPVYQIPNPVGGSGGGSEGSQDGGSGDAEQTTNYTIRVLGVDIPCWKDTVATSAEDGDVSRQQVQPASTGTGDGACSNSQGGESSMWRPKSRLRLLGFDI